MFHEIPGLTLVSRNGICQNRTMIDFQYFDGCPNAGDTWNNLEMLIREGLIRRESVRRIEVPDMESAEKHQFQGSPTILIDGVDIYSGSKPEGVHYTCRIFTFDGVQTGVIPKEFIRQKLHEREQQEHPPVPEDGSASG